MILITGSQFNKDIQPDEYEILESSEDIDYISCLELERQKEYGYRVDLVPYKNLKPNKRYEDKRDRTNHNFSLSSQ